MTHKTSKTQWNRRQVLQGAAAATALATAPGRFAVGEGGNPDVLVLGAGLSGLNAALNLEDIGYRVTLLEGSHRIGGRLFTADEAEVPGQPEMGGSGIGSHYARILDAASHYKVEIEESRPRTEPRKNELMYHVRDAAIRIEDWADHPLNPFVDAANRSRSLSGFQYSLYDDDINPFPVRDFTAWQNGRHGDLDISVHDFLLRKGVSEQAIKLACSTNMSYGSSAHDLSILMGFQSSNLIRSLYRGPDALPGRSMAIAGGNQRLPEAMARGLKSEIALGQNVRSIQTTSSGVTVTTAAGDVFRAKYCICTFPFSALKHVHVDPYLQGLQAEAVHELAYTPVFQVHVVPKRRYWEDDGLPPSMWTDRTPGRFMALKNNPDAPDEYTSCMSFVNGEMAKYLDRLPPEAAGQRVLADLAEMRPATKGALEIAKIWSWNRSIFAGGAYAYWQPGQITRFSAAMRAPHDRIHFAGEHTAVVNRGMEGAMESGERAAIEVLQQLG